MIVFRVRTRFSGEDESLFFALRFRYFLLQSARKSNPAIIQSKYCDVVASVSFGKCPKSAL